MVKKGLLALGVLLLLIAALAGAGLWYVKPQEKLDLAYRTVPLEQRAIGMAKNLSTTLALSESDVDNIAKAYIASDPRYGPDVTVTGARFDIEDGRIAAHYNLKVKNRIPVGVVVYYRVQWRDPNLVAVVDEAKLRSRTLPKRYFDDIVIPLGSSVPKPIRIRSAALQGDKLVITIKKPTLAELTRLLRRELGL
ncbi:hypothetical protein I8J29_17210 [Paenibacillus sp. MWE-103]|uniref:TATA-box binding protein n=1 Tax=Paenibacillus artemisiicola TaxID=1172618 RepID=A0ABS3WCD9_9BACL|nr:hypothetical protein [Paenibacillus artemisiicola]MBO7745949.1 hypothetical protein [Paenibacillus artemisiicola]